MQAVGVRNMNIVLYTYIFYSTAFTAYNYVGRRLAPKHVIAVAAAVVHVFSSNSNNSNNNSNSCNQNEKPHNFTNIECNIYMHSHCAALL